MKNYKSVLCVLVLVLMHSFAARAAAGPPLTFKFSMLNVPGAAQTEPGGVNNAGVSVGLYFDSAGVQHGYILEGKKLTTLDDPKAIAGTTSASGLNPNGAITVVGTYVSRATGGSVGFLYKNGKYEDIKGPSKSRGTVAAGINDAGAIVGFYEDSSSAVHGFLLKGQKYTIRDYPGAASTYATGINNSGEISMYYYSSAGEYESALYENGKYRTINVPGATASCALDLNSKGDVVYKWEDSSGDFHGALLLGGKYYEFDGPGAVFTYGGGINDKNTIVGGFETTNGGPFSGFKATFTEKLPFCSGKTCLYYAGDFDSIDSNANGLFNANDQADGLDGQTWVGVIPTQNATVTGATFNEFLTTANVGTNPTPFAVNTGMSVGNAGTTVCNTSGNATAAVYGESDFGLIQYSYTIAQLSDSCPFTQGTTYYVNLLPTYTTSAYGYVANVEDNPAPNHQGWANDLDDCFFNGAAFGADYTTCNSQGTFDELSIALTGSTDKNVFAMASTAMRGRTSHASAETKDPQPRSRLTSKVSPTLRRVSGH